MKYKIKIIIFFFGIKKVNSKDFWKKIKFTKKKEKKAIRLIIKPQFSATKKELNSLEKLGIYINNATAGILKCIFRLKILETLNSLGDIAILSKLVRIKNNHTHPGTQIKNIILWVKAMIIENFIFQTSMLSTKILRKK